MKNIEQKLLKKNTNPTSMRILVYDFLEEQQIAMSLSEIESHFYKADRITIYRTLKTFEEKVLYIVFETITRVSIFYVTMGAMRKLIKIGICTSTVKFVNRQPVKKILQYHRKLTMSLELTR